MIHWSNGSNTNKVACGASDWKTAMCIAVNAVTCPQCISILTAPDYLLIYCSPDWIIERQSDKHIVERGSLVQMQRTLLNYSNACRSSMYEDMKRNPSKIFQLSYTYGQGVI